ncbi:MAG: general secretion pathway protein GspK [Firmicutes bacterium]|nr:general secretion pathway protein GspK [Bacillota bacterium]
MVLLSVLGAIGIIYIMMVQLSSDVIFTSQYYQKTVFKEKAYYISRSAYAAASQLFAMDSGDVDSKFDMWAQEMPPYDLEEEQATIQVKIEDEDRKLNPNLLLAGTTPPKENIELFRRLFRNIDLEPDTVNTLLDWIDADSERRIPCGAEGLDYPKERPAKNGDLDSIEEIKYIKGMEDYYNGRVSNGVAYPGLKDVLTVWSGQKVNINTADKDVLLALDDEMTTDLVAEIIRKRETEPIKKMDDLVDATGMSHDLLYRIKKFADVKSGSFRITLTVQSYDKKDSAELTAIYRRGKKTGGRLVFWQVQ